MHISVPRGGSQPKAWMHAMLVLADALPLKTVARSDIVVLRYETSQEVRRFISRMGKSMIEMKHLERASGLAKHENHDLELWIAKAGWRRPLQMVVRLLWHGGWSTSMKQTKHCEKAGSILMYILDVLL